MSATDYRNHFVYQSCHILKSMHYFGKYTKIKVIDQSSNMKLDGVSLLVCEINVAAIEFRKDCFLRRHPHDISVWFGLKLVMKSFLAYSK